MCAMIALVLVWGCAEPPAATAVSDSDLPEVNTPQIQPGLTPEEVGAVLSEQLGALPDPAQPVAVYLELMASGDGACPGDLYQILDTWLYGCDATTGYHYAGISQFFEEQTSVTGIMMDIQGVKGDFWINTPAGDSFEIGGHAFIGEMEGGWGGRLEGSLDWSAGEPWLVSGFSGIYEVVFMADRFLQIDGAMDMEGVYIGLEALLLDASCGWGPTGTLRLRDLSGGWYALPLTDCSPCGMLSFEGSEQGEVCLDLEPLRSAFGLVAQ
ncbi:MAG: hypothetical protein P8R54_28195 [Myxococcota bacterium]|nr:hypothetical protein [Myxococcota bacterium]